MGGAQRLDRLTVVGGGAEQVLAGVLLADPGAVDAGPGAQPVGDDRRAGGKAQQQRRGQEHQRGAAARRHHRGAATRHVRREPTDQDGGRVIGEDTRERVGGLQAPVEAVARGAGRGTDPTYPTGRALVVRFCHCHQPPRRAALWPPSERRCPAASAV